MTAPSDKSRVLLGEIGPAHGIRGDVVVRSYTAAPEDIAAYGPLSTADGTRQFALKVVRVTDKGVVCRVAGISDRNAAEALRGIALYADRTQLPPPEEGAFYHADLVGLAAFDTTGRPLGTVVGVHNFGADDLLEIAEGGHSRGEFIPFTRACVPVVDIAGGRIEVVPPMESEHEDASNQ